MSMKNRYNAVSFSPLIEEQSDIARLIRTNALGEIALPKKILLIEDDLEFSEIISNSIKSFSNSEVEIAYDPFQASNLISENAFDLIIADWNLPALNAFGTLRIANHSLDRDPAAPDSWFERKTPVIVLSVCDKADIEMEKKIKGHFTYLGIVSKKQALNKIVLEISNLYSSQNKPRGSFELPGPLSSTFDSGFPF